jgi:DNA adenine methylase
MNTATTLNAVSTKRESVPIEGGVVPFLKWAGGKRWLARDLKSRIGAIAGTYIEPFLGSAAVYFAVLPDRALLSDCNRDLVRTYRALQLQYKAVLRHLVRHQTQHSTKFYYEMRDQRPRTLATQAARFIYLNRTCWNGLYRVNTHGEFNVPIGTKDTVLMANDDFARTHDVLKNAQISCCDFEYSIDQAGAGDVLFCDPPYTVRHKFNGFVKYNETLFSWADQVRLRDSLLRAKDRGARVFVTNADHASIHELYSRRFSIQSTSRFSPIGGLKAVRGEFSELLITG